MTASAVLFRTMLSRLSVFMTVVVIAVLVSGWWFLPTAVAAVLVLEVMSYRELRSTTDTGRTIAGIGIRAHRTSDHTARLVFSLAGSYIVTGSGFAQLSPPEQEAVLFHEVGHHVTLPHVDQIGYAVFTATLIFHTPLTTASHPVLLMAVLLSVIMAWKLVSRMSETGADAWAGRDPVTAHHLASALEKLVAPQHMHLRFHAGLLADHPAPADRIARLRQWAGFVPTLKP